MHSPFNSELNQFTEPGWLKIAEWSLPCFPHCDPVDVQQLFDELDDSMAAMGPRISKRIRGVIIRAALDGLERSKESASGTSISVSIYCRCSDPKNLSGDGWSHFLIERIQVLPEQPEKITTYSIDVYLYREGTRSQ